MLHKLVVSGDILLPIFEPDMSITRLSSEVVIHIQDNLMKTCHYRLILIISYLLDDQVRPSKHDTRITKPIKCTRML